jgi:hypothetical protein
MRHQGRRHQKKMAVSMLTAMVNREEVAVERRLSGFSARR